MPCDGCDWYIPYITCTCTLTLAGDVEGKEYRSAGDTESTEPVYCNLYTKLPGRDWTGVSQRSCDPSDESPHKMSAEYNIVREGRKTKTLPRRAKERDFYMMNVPIHIDHALSAFTQQVYGCFAIYVKSLCVTLKGGTLHRRPYSHPRPGSK